MTEFETVKNGYTYYDHALTKIEKNNLLRSIDEIKRPFASKETSDDGEQVSSILSECKDKRLISILQILLIFIYQFKINIYSCH